MGHQEEETIAEIHTPPEQVGNIVDKQLEPDLSQQ